MSWEILAGVVISVAVVWLLLLGLFWLLRPQGVPLRELLSVVLDTTHLIRSLIADGTVALDVRLVLAALLVWILSPIDLIPEFIPVLGPIDDVVVAVVALRYARRRLGATRLRARWPGSDEGFAILARVIGAHR